MGIIGLLTGIVAAFIDICVKELFKLKYNLFEQGEECVVIDAMP